MTKENNRYNRTKLRADFLNSEFEKVKTRWKKWLKSDQKVTYNAYIKKKTKGRSADKKHLLHELEQQATEEAKSKLLAEYQINQEEYLEMKKTCIKLLKAKLGLIGKTAKMWKDFSARDILNILEKVKTELGEPNTITENKNINISEESNPLQKKLLELKMAWNIES